MNTVSNPLQGLLDNNRRWASQMEKEHPGFFTNLAEGQKPQYMWLGCADSRVPVTRVIDALPGEVFVHRNIANVLDHSDLSCLASLQYAVDVLKVEHVLVVGHYGCGGVQAALKNKRVGLADNWVQHVRNVQHHHEQRMGKVAYEKQLDALCELNTIEQVLNVSQTTVLSDAWASGRNVYIHGWLYHLDDGLIFDTEMTVSSSENITQQYNLALEKWDSRYLAM